MNYISSEQSPITISSCFVRKQSPVLEAERLLMSEKNNEISALRNRIEVLTACQSDLMDDISSYKEDVSKLNGRIEELERENQSFRLHSNLNKTFTIGSPCETPERARSLTATLQEKLKGANSYVEVLELKLEEKDSKLADLEKLIGEIKDTLQATSERENMLMKELAKQETEGLRLSSEIEYKDEVIKKLQQEVEDYRWICNMILRFDVFYIGAIFPV